MNRIVPDWPAPPGVRAVCTTREDGSSKPPYASFNLAAHVGDDSGVVAENRARLRAVLSLPAEPLWLDQVHGRQVVRAMPTTTDCVGDASVADRAGTVCAVLTADCLPVLLCDRTGTRVAAVHAGWRGLAKGVIEAAVSALAVPADQVLAWLGPAIGPAAFEVGSEVREAFVAQDRAAEPAFTLNQRDRWQADLYSLARRRLGLAGVESISGGGLCTFTDERRFFSFRRDGTTGRMASLIWIGGR